ncbi:hypothetical protein ABMA27_003101 [Loxostege sticticalis]|uniref:Tyr recombinase domain-containing protein n=1 Tax=Loxostege sticticalis TaxID=481309 RepID=A0ABR3HRY5_LOXSC
MIMSLSDSTAKQYDTYLKPWYQFCISFSINYLEGSVPQVLSFLTKLVEQGASYGSINCAKSALSLLLGSKISTDDRLKRFMKGVFRLNPPQPKYDVTWDPQIVLNFLSCWYPNENLILENLTKKLVTLLAIATGHRVQTLSLIKTQNIQQSNQKILIKIPDLIKTSRPGSNQPLLTLPFFLEKPQICPAKTLVTYINMTKTKRNNCENLFISFKKPYNKVTSQTISRWIKDTLSDSGIDTSIFTAHSTRHASTSAAKRCGVNIDVIRKTAGWSESSKTFAKFYNRDFIESCDFASSIFL